MVQVEQTLLVEFAWQTSCARYNRKDIDSCDPYKLGIRGYRCLVESWGIFGVTEDISNHCGNSNVNGNGNGIETSELAPFVRR